VGLVVQKWVGGDQSPAWSQGRGSSVWFALQQEEGESRWADRK